MRAWLVIALVLQSLGPVGLTATAAAPARDAGCACAGAACCCDDACSCAAPADAPEPGGPPAPLPRDGKEITPLPAPALCTIAVGLPDHVRPGLRVIARPLSGPSPSEAQALLCVWRT